MLIWSLRCILVLVMLCAFFNYVTVCVTLQNLISESMLKNDSHSLDILNGKLTTDLFNQECWYKPTGLQWKHVWKAILLLNT